MSKGGGSRECSAGCGDAHRFDGMSVGKLTRQLTEEVAMAYHRTMLTHWMQGAANFAKEAKGQGQCVMFIPLLYDADPITGGAASNTINTKRVMGMVLPITNPLFAGLRLAQYDPTKNILVVIFIRYGPGPEQFMTSQFLLPMPIN